MYRTNIHVDIPWTPTPSPRKKNFDPTMIGFILSFIYSIVLMFYCIKLKAHVLTQVRR